MSKSSIGIALAIIVAVGGSLWFTYGSQLFSQTSLTSTTEGNQAGGPSTATGLNNGTIAANFSCPSGQMIGASFDNAANTVHLTLSDGRTLDLPHALSADGARYANADESLVFWNKGRGAFITENGTTTFADCEESGPMTR